MNLQRLTLLTVLALTACKGGSDTKEQEPDTSTTEPEPEPEPVLLGGPDVVYGLPNLDNEGDDWAAADPDDPQIVAFTITPSEVVEDAEEDEVAASVRFTQSGSGNLRVWHEGMILVDGQGPNWELDATEEPIELAVEFREFDVEGELLVEELNADGDVLQETSVRLRSSPLVLNHHLQPAELVVAVETSYYGFDNDAFIDGYAAILGDRFEAARGQRYFQDPWMQDEIEFATGTTPDGDRLDLVIDSIRDRGLDDYPEDRFAAESFGVKTWGRGYASSQDAFGNLEVTPPIDGYPFGRIYWGDGGGYWAPQADRLFETFEDNRIQEPFTVDISWLCVGHVDEFMTFIPDSTAPRGFRFVINDVNAAWEVLDAMDPATPLPRYAGGYNHGYSTVGEMVDDLGLRDHNDDIQSQYIDPIRQQMKDELGLTDDEIILLPGLFETVGGCYGTDAALIPGMANLIVTDFGDGTKLFMADPFLREDLSDQSTDPMIQAVTDIMPAEAELHFLDDWEIYHLGLGEVHCGSNVLRTPSSADWWTNDLGGSQ